MWRIISTVNISPLGRVRCLGHVRDDIERRVFRGSEGYLDQKNYTSCAEIVDFFLLDWGWIYRTRILDKLLLQCFSVIKA